MPTFQQRRDTILSQFAQAKADLETLNSDIDTEIEKNKSVKCTNSITSQVIMLLTLDIRTNGSRNENPDCNSSRFESGLILINQSL